MALSFDPISSPGATRDLFVDLSRALEPDETLTQATVVSGYPANLVISNIEINDTVVDYQGQSIAVGKGVCFSITTLQQSHAVVPLTVSFEGSSGTKDQYEVLQPMVRLLCR